MALILTPRAKLDIMQAAAYIADFNPEAARNWRRSILETCRALARMPGMGHAIDDAKSLRLFSKEKYLIFFQVDDGDVCVVRVLHAARDWPKLVR